MAVMLASLLSSFLLFLFSLLVFSLTKGNILNYYMLFGRMRLPSLVSNNIIYNISRGRRKWRRRKKSNKYYVVFDFYSSFFIWRMDLWKSFSATLKDILIFQNEWRERKTNNRTSKELCWYISFFHWYYLVGLKFTDKGLNHVKNEE